jgi:hypothetical protein
MLEILQFIFSGFWVAVGVMFLVSVLGSAIAEIIKAIRG